MQVLLSDACQQQRKPAIAFVGATVQPDLSTTATSMVTLPALAHPLHTPCFQAPLPRLVYLSYLTAKLPRLLPCLPVFFSLSVVCLPACLSI